MLMQIDSTMAAASATEVANKVGSVASNPIFWSAGTLGFFAFLGVLVVMIVTRPRSDEEWTVGLISSLVSSVCGGALVIVMSGMYKWLALANTDPEKVMVVMAWGGVIFACALPGWATVRLLFNTMKAHQDQTIEQAAHDMADMARDIKGAL